MLGTAFVAIGMVGTSGAGAGTVVTPAAVGAEFAVEDVAGTVPEPFEGSREEFTSNLDWAPMTTNRMMVAAASARSRMGALNRMW